MYATETGLCSCMSTMSTFVAEWGAIVESVHIQPGNYIIYYVLGSLIVSMLYSVFIMLIVK